MFWEEAKESLIIFGILYAVFVPLQTLFAAQKQNKVFRKQWFTDWLFFTGQYLVWTAPVVAILGWVHTQLSLLPFQDFRAAVAAQPLWLQVIEVILLCDVGIYWGHRISHRVPLLWRFHRVHHTAPELDWIAAYREHPLDNLFTRLIENLPALILGFPLGAIAGLVAFRGIWGLVIHSNLKLELGPLKYFLGSPKLHHWHHEKHMNHKCNFANLMPLMDVIFGTYFEPKGFPKKYGVPEKVHHNYFVQMVSPLVPWGLFGLKKGPPPQPSPRKAGGGSVV